MSKNKLAALKGKAQLLALDKLRKATSPCLTCKVKKYLAQKPICKCEFGIWVTMNGCLELQKLLALARKVKKS